jgi:hypothetical protein
MNGRASRAPADVRRSLGIASAALGPGVRFGLLLAFSVTAGCAAGHRIEWTEDARLGDGRTILLARYQDFDGPWQIFQPRTPSRYGFEFRMPGSDASVSWSSDIDLVPLALLMGGVTPILLTTPIPGGMLGYQCPDPPYPAFEFVHRRGGATP